jgi:hypothetical protein
MNMEKLSKTLLITSLIMLFTACNIGRGFNAAPPAYEGWIHKEGYSKGKSIEAMQACGYLSADGQIPVSDNNNNTRATLQECMFAKNFHSKDGYGGICTLSNNRTTLPACANAPIRSRDSYYGN